jgi:hypothetical protein
LVVVTWICFVSGREVGALVRGLTAWGLHPIGAEVVEPGVEVKLRLLDALDWQRLRAGQGQPVGFGPCGGASPKDHAVSRCLTAADGVIRSWSG